MITLQNRSLLLATILLMGSAHTFGATPSKNWTTKAKKMIKEEAPAIVGVGAGVAFVYFIYCLSKWKEEIRLAEYFKGHAKEANNIIQRYQELPTEKTVHQYVTDHQLRLEHPYTGNATELDTAINSLSRHQDALTQATKPEEIQTRNAIPGMIERLETAKRVILNTSEYATERPLAFAAQRTARQLEIQEQTARATQQHLAAMGKAAQANAHAAQTAADATRTIANAHMMDAATGRTNRVTINNNR